MKIAVNTRLLRPGKLDGIGWFAYNTLRNIVREHPDIAFHFFFDGPPDQQFLFAPNVVPHRLYPPAKQAFLNLCWTEVAVRRKLRQLKPDLYFSPDGMLCMGWHGKQHAVIHDINFVHNPRDLKWTNRWFYNTWFPRYARKAVRLATVSEYSKRDISDTYGMDPDGIDVVYCGINSFFAPLTTDLAQKVRHQYTDGLPYFFFVGTLSPRKNVTGIMRAYDLFRHKTGLSFRLVIAGGGMYKTREIEDCRRHLRFGDEIVFTGRLSDAELAEVFGAAQALVFVPHFEGFGIPLVEAMQCRVPIIASAVTSIPEVTGDAALLVDPGSVDEIADAMARLATDKELGKILVDRGTRRKDNFSWDKTSALLWESICKAL